MDKMDIKNCNNIEALKQLCLSQKSQLDYINETLDVENRWEITAKEAIKRIRGYMDHQHELELPEKEKSLNNISTLLKDATLEEKEVIKTYIDEMSKRINFYDELKMMENEVIKNYLANAYPDLDLQEAVNKEMNTLYTNPAHYHKFYNTFCSVLKNKEDKEE